MMLIAGLLLLLGTLVGAALTGAIAFHFWNYGVQGDRSRILAMTCVAGSVLWVIITWGAYFAIPWDTLLTNIPIPTITNPTP